MAAWVIKTEPPESEYLKAIRTVNTLAKPIVDVEQVFTDLDLGQGAFCTFTHGEREKLEGRIRQSLRAFFLSIHPQNLTASLYADLVRRIATGDALITFNYDVALENELIHAQKFRIRNGYGRGFEADWDEPGSDVTVLKLHGSINWVGSLFGGARGGHFGQFYSSLGPRPFVDNTDLAFPDYPKAILDKSFPCGGVLDGAPTLLLPTYEKQFFVQTSVGKEWIPFYMSLRSQASEFLEDSERVLIIGYSMPAADREAAALILSRSSKCAAVFVCCASSNESLAARFRDRGFLHVHQIGGFAEWLLDPRSTQ
jgi:hypothetical protein